MYSLPWPAGSYQIWGFPQFLHDHSLAAELHLILNHQTQNEVFVSSSLEKKFTDKSDPSHMYFTSENLKSSCHLPHSQYIGHLLLRMQGVKIIYLQKSKAFWVLFFLVKSGDRRERLAKFIFRQSTCYSLSVREPLSRRFIKRRDTRHLNDINMQIRNSWLKEKTKANVVFSSRCVWCVH